MSKQMRISDVQYKMLSQLAESLGISRVEILSNSINLAKSLIDNKAKAVKIVCNDGVEKELLLPMLAGLNDES